ncbi:MAG TPA: hypothetical protein PKK26_12905, partial [Candidatus Wallbacteria bacterium]|nr:hypothetical protein [Candidatus Wallbacteria bacterium]
IILVLSYYFFFKIIASHSNSSVARFIEKKDCLNNYLTTSVEITPEQISRYGFSPELYELTVERAYEHYKTKTASDYIDRTIILKLAKSSLILLFSLSLLVAGCGLKSINKFWPQLVSVFLPKPIEIISLNRDFSTFTGEGIDLKFKFARAEKLILFVHYGEDRQKSIFHEFPDERGTVNYNLRSYIMKLEADTPENGLYKYHCAFNGTGQNFYYMAASAESESKSRTFFVTMKRRPDITRVNAVYEFPKYTGIAPMSEENVTDINGLFGTLVKITAYSSVPVKKAEMTFAGGTTLPMDVSKGGKTFSGLIRLSENGGYRLSAEDADGNRNREGKFHDINVYPDKPPTCEIIEPQAEINAPADRTLNITAKAGDDFGISKMALFYYKNESDQESFEISLHEKNAAEIIQKAVLSLEAITVKPGEAVYYYVAAWDNDVVSGPKMTRSAVNKINFPTQYDEALEIEKLQESIEARLEKLGAEQKAITEKAGELAELQKQKTMSDYEIRKNFENIARRQENLVKEAKEISNDLKDAIKKMENNVYIKPETLAKISEIQENLSNILNEDMKRLMSQINQNVQKAKLTGDDVKKLAESFDEKKLLEKFERLKELFSKAEREQKLSTFVKELENALSRQEFVNENTEKASPEVKELNKELSGEQKAIKEIFDKSFSDFKKDIEKIGEIAPEIKQSSQEAAESLKNDGVSESMRKAEDELSKMNPKDALGEQKKIVASLKKNIEKLKKSFDDFKKKNKKDLLDELSRLIEKTIKMSRLEEEIASEFVAVAALNRPGTLEKYVDALDGVSEKCIELSNVSRNVISELMELSKKTMLVDPNHVAMAGMIYRMFDSIKPHLAEHELSSAMNLANQLSAGINLLNVALLDIFDIVNSAKSGSNMDQLMEMLKKQAEAQARLNAKTKQMGQKLGPDGMPQLTPEGMKMLAFEQQMIRRSMERIMDGMEPNGEMAKRMKEIRNEMRSLESEYLRKQVDSKIQTRQKILQERLLEMQKALFKEKETTERKAETAKNYEISAPKDGIKKDDIKNIQKNELRLEDTIKNEKYPKSYEKIIELYLNAIQKI